jgi:aryl-alcohol dehydrogenase-like predicted oxidoreductase
VPSLRAPFGCRFNGSTQHTRLLAAGPGCPLTGKYAPHGPPPRDSRGADERTSRKSKRFRDQRVLEAVQRLRPIAEALSLSMSQLALAWVLRDSRVSSAAIGASRPEQIEENVGAVGIELDNATLRRIDDALEGVVRR